MGKKCWIASGVILGLLATVVFAQITTHVTRSVPKWNYGTYVTEVGENGEKRASWYEGGGSVTNCSASEFCQKMSIPASNTKVDEVAMTPAFEVAVFQVLGRRGWELISHPEKDGKRTTYLFKRAIPQ